MSPPIATGPGFEGGRVVSGLTSLMDLAPTVLAAGVEKLDYMPGIPLQRAAACPQEPIRDAVFIQISESCVGCALRTPERVYCVEAPEGTNPLLSDSPLYIKRYLCNIWAMK